MRSALPDVPKASKRALQTSVIIAMAALLLSEWVSRAVARRIAGH